MKFKQAFTLVELIVVVTILAILATIGFVSYSGYLTGVRDTNRIASLTSISDGLELYRTKNDLPNPDESIEIQVEGTTIAQQGYVGSNVLQTIEYSKAGKDPKDDSFYSYYLTDDKKHYQLMAFLEESDNLESSILQNINAATDYKNRYPKVYGKRLGILTDSDNTPVQETVTGALNFTSGMSTIYKAFFTDDNIDTSSGASLINKLPLNSNCKRLKDTGKNRDGIYKVRSKNGGEIDVYCDMKNGGWAILIGVSPDSNNLAYNSSEWITPSINTNLGSVLSEDIITQGYSDLVTNKIKICKADFKHCFEMNHNMNRTLQSFYVDDVSYIDFSRHEYRDDLDATHSYNTNPPPEIGINRKDDFFSDLGINYTHSIGFNKYGAGINIHLRNKIGYQADNNGAWPGQDNIAFGIGGFSPYPSGCNITTIGTTTPLSSSYAKSIAYHHICVYYTPSPDLDRWYILGQ